MTIMERQDALRDYIQTKLVPGLNRIVGDEDDLLMSGLLDSLSVMRLLSFIQQRFGIDVPPEDVVYENFATLNAIARYLETR